MVKQGYLINLMYRKSKQLKKQLQKNRYSIGIDYLLKNKQTILNGVYNNMYKSYNYSTLLIKDSKADSLAVKGKDTAVQTYSFIDGVATIDRLRNTFSVNSLKSSQYLRCNACSLRAMFHPIRSEAPLRF